MPFPRQTTKKPSSADGEIPAHFAVLCHSVIGVHNPQHRVNDEPGEAEIARFICSWLSSRKIAHTCDLSWGIHAKLTGPAGPGSPGVLLAAHMDSDHLRRADLNRLRVDGATLHCPGLVGLDCKTGIAIILSVLERLIEATLPGAWQVHALFTVGEESGQKGAIGAPLCTRLAGRVRYGVVVDRMTSGSGCPYDKTTGEPVRHLVCCYKSVPLLDNFSGSGDELLRHLNAAHAAADPAAAARIGTLPLIESPNCADAIELRGRWDAEVIAPSMTMNPVLKSALAEYWSATEAVTKAMASCAPDERVGSMNAHPRFTRYQAMQKLYHAVQAGAFDASLGFSCVNLSYNYDDDWDTCDLRELDTTANIILQMCQSCFRE